MNAAVTDPTFCCRARGRRAVRLGACLLTVLIGANVAGAAEPLHPAVAEARQEALSARGPERYAAMRSLWKAWDQTDPIQVEQTLREFATDPAVDAPSRAYASLLSAYARRRRGDLEGSKRQVRALGFVNQWLVLGPFDNEGKAGLNRPFAPESELAAPIALDRTYEGKERAVRWRTVPDVFPYGWVDLGALLRPREKICGYATTFVRRAGAHGGVTNATAWIGVAGAFRMFWNGEEVLSDSGYRELDPDRMATRVDIKPGWNRLTIKICNDDAAPMVALRLADPQGAPDPSLETSADPKLSEQPQHSAVPAAERPQPAGTDAVVVKATAQQGAVVRPAAPPKRRPEQGGVAGVLQQFQRADARKGASPATLEAYARYLVLTGGDDPAENRARELARRAAEQGPGVRRMLLAGGLAEDRNQEREWVEKAARLANSPSEVRVLLAYGRLERRSPNWREAVPYFDRVLRVDPDNVEAILGRVDLYNEAGLKRTALGVLEQAIERNPRSVALLSAFAAQLTTLDRQVEADEISDRYSAYRFDDASFQSWRVRLAVARRDKKLAEHWIGRMLATDPDSARNLGIAAHAWMELGLPERSIEAFRHALELAPEDTDTMKEMASALGVLGRRAEQVQLLRKVLALRPQFRDVREYVEQIEPPKPRSDEAYAWPADRFLPMRSAPAAGFNERTLRDLQVTTVYDSGLSSRFRQVVFQPLTDEAAASSRQYAFAYQADRQTVQLRAARVYRADGKIDEATETTEGRADNPEIAMYTSARTFYVQFPRLHPSDIVELQYRIDDTSSENAFADYFGEIVYLQSSIPVMNSEYVVIAPRTRALNFEVSPIPGLVREIKETADGKLFRFFAASVPALLPEPNMPPWPEVRAHVHVSTYNSWDDVGKWYSGLARDQLTPDDEVRSLVEKITKGLATDQDKVRAIYDYVVKQTRYVALEFGIYGFKPRRASQTFARGWGDCKDKAALIVTMLRVVGIPANLVIVRTGMRGDFPSQPASLAPFDHAIAYVPSLDLYLDGTAQWTGVRELPAMDRGALALVVGEQSAKLVKLPDPPADQSQRMWRLEATLAPNGSAQVDLRFELTGAFGPQWRERFHSPATRRDRMSHDLAGEMTGFELAPGNAGLETNDLEDIEQSAKIHVRGKAPAFARKEGADLSIPVTPPERFVPTLASISQRQHDLRMRFQSVLDETWTVRLPAGMVVKSLPSNATKTSPFGSFEIKVERKEGAVTVRTRIAFTRTRIKPSEYSEFQKYCEEIDRALAQRLVVSKP